MKRFLTRMVAMMLAAFCLPLSALADEEAARLFSFSYEEGKVIESGTQVTVDFGLGQSLAPDLIAWLYQEDTGTDHPVMRGTKGNIYEKRTMTGAQKGKYGCAYLPNGASEDLSQGNLILYGRSSDQGPLHNLKNYTKQAYYEEHPYYRLFTPQGDYQLDIFACLSNTSLTDEQLTAPDSEAEFTEWLSSMVSGSKIQPLTDAVPAFGERTVLLTNSSRGKRIVLLAAVRPVEYRTDRVLNISKMQMDSIPSDGRVVDAGPLGKLYVYFQRDSIWADLRFESTLTSRYRKVSGGACGPFALSNIIINMVDINTLPVLMKDTENETGTLFCKCSVNQLYCNKQHIPYRPVTALEYARYLPIVVCDYCAGNNIYGVCGRHPAGKGGTQSVYVPYVCNAVGLHAEVVNQLAEGLEKMENNGGTGALFCAALDSSPFSFPGGSHFVAIIGISDGYAYVLDSIARDKYKSKGNIVEWVEPGLARFKVEYMSGVSLCPQYYITAVDPGTAPTDFTDYNPGQTLN